MTENRTPAWHVDAELAGAYATGRTSPVLTASLEQHLVGCAECRALVATLVPVAPLEATWTEVLERIERPAPRLLERLLHGVGIDASTARLVALTPSLRGAWLTGVVVVLVLAIGFAHADPRGVAVFLAVAPLLPLAGVAVVFGPRADPAHELAAAAPYSSVRLLALRTALVVTTTLLPAAGIGLLLPDRGWHAVAWLLPALALTTATVAAGTRVPPALAAGALAALWLAAVGPALRPHRDPLLASQAPVQVACLALLVLAVAALVGQRHTLSETIRRTA